MDDLIGLLQERRERELWSLREMAEAIGISEEMLRSGLLGRRRFGRRSLRVIRDWWPDLVPAIQEYRKSVVRG